MCPLFYTFFSHIFLFSLSSFRDLVDEAKNYLLLPQERPLMQGPRTRPRKPIRCGEVLFAGESPGPQHSTAQPSPAPDSQQSTSVCWSGISFLNRGKMECIETELLRWGWIKKEGRETCVCVCVCGKKKEVKTLISHFPLLWIYCDDSWD